MKQFSFYKILFYFILLVAGANVGGAQELPASAKEIIARWQSDPNRQNLNDLRNLGFAMLRAQKFVEATQVFENILQKIPREPFSLYGQAVGLFNLRRIAEAEKSADGAIEIFLSDEKNKNFAVEPLILSATISAVQKDNAAAIEKLQKAIRIAPDNFNVNFALARAFYGSGDLTNAIKYFQKTMDLQPANPQAKFFLATVLEESGDLPSALKIYRELTKLAPDDPNGNLGLGSLLIKLEGETSVEGLKALQRAVALKGDLYEARVALGKTLIRLNRAAEAIVHLEKAAEIAPSNPEPPFQLALAYRKLGKRAEAERETARVRQIHESRRAVTVKSP